jgi:hypothetical protein
MICLYWNPININLTTTNFHLKTQKNADITLLCVLSTLSTGPNINLTELLAIFEGANKQPDRSEQHLKGESMSHGFPYH